MSGLVAAVVALAVLTLMSIVRAIYRCAKWDDAPSVREESTVQMYAAGAALLMAALSLLALVATANTMYRSA